ncbi:MAG: DUF2778 domain-containing protein [Proteobacteria bacterium]|nr:DUF2778 domain-containing protein [Pseudomonadota bacterium]
MNTSAAAYFDASWVDDRRVSPRVRRRALRGILNSSILGLGTVAALGTAAIAVTLAAGWMASSAVAPRVRLPIGPASLALVPYDPSVQTTARAPTSWSTAFIDRTKPLIAEPGRRAIATPTAAPVRHAARPAAIPLPRPLPARLAQTRADLGQASTVANLAPQTVTPPAQSLMPQPIADQVPRVLSLATPMPTARPEIKTHPPAAVEPAAKPEGSSKIEMLAKADVSRVEPKAATPKLSAPATIPSAMPDSVSRTAVYDISEGIVHMPDGSRLEAHSGMGEKMDDPRYIKVRMRGPTPPNVYVLTERESLFHGVRAIRLNPVDRGRMFGRDGMLAHTYMIGPTGQSNGCVSFKDYRKFLTAFLDGKVDKMVVVPDLRGTSWKAAALEAQGVNASPRRFAGGYSRPRIFPGESDSGPRYTAALAYGSERGAGTW